MSEDQSITNLVDVFARALAQAEPDVNQWRDHIFYLCQRLELFASELDLNHPEAIAGVFGGVADRLYDRSETMV